MQNFIFANFCASFAHEAEQFLHNIPHHRQQVLRIFAQIEKLRKFFTSTIISEKASFCAKTKFVYLLEEKYGSTSSERKTNKQTALNP